MHLLRYANEWNVPTTHLPEIFLATLKRILKSCDDHKSKFISFKKKWKYFERSSTDFPFFLGHNFEQNPSRWPSSLLSIRNAINAGHRQEKLMCNDWVASRLLLFRVYLGLLATLWVSWLKQSIWLASVPVDQILQRKTCRFTRNFTEFSLLLFFSEKVLLIFTGRYRPKASHGVGPRWWPRTATRKHERRVFSRMLQDGFRAQGGRNQTDAHSIPLIVQVGFVWRRKLTAGPTQINYSGNCSRLFIARHSALYGLYN